LINNKSETANEVATEQNASQGWKEVTRAPYIHDTILLPTF